MTSVINNAIAAHNAAVARNEEISRQILEAHQLKVTATAYDWLWAMLNDGGEICTVDTESFPDSTVDQCCVMKVSDDAGNEFYVTVDTGGEELFGTLMFWNATKCVWGPVSSTSSFHFVDLAGLGRALIEVDKFPDLHLQVPREEPDAAPTDT